MLGGDTGRLGAGSALCSANTGTEEAAPALLPLQSWEPRTSPSGLLPPCAVTGVYQTPRPGKLNLYLATK
jgi:hypothetical protein